MIESASPGKVIETFKDFFIFHKRGYSTKETTKTEVFETPFRFISSLNLLIIFIFVFYLYCVFFRYYMLYFFFICMLLYAICFMFVIVSVIIVLFTKTAGVL